MINRNRLNASHQEETRKSTGATAHAAEATKPMTIPTTMIREGFGGSRRSADSGTRRPGAGLGAGLLPGLSPGILPEGRGGPGGRGGIWLLMDARWALDRRTCSSIGPVGVLPVKCGSRLNNEACN